jgi:hypothetical protein
LETLFRDISTFSPNIAELSIHNIYGSTLQDFDDILNTFLPSLPRLTSLVIGNGDLTSRSFTSIALLPCLTKLEIYPVYSRKGKGNSGYTEEWRLSNLQLHSVLKPLQNPFPSLRSLAIQVRSGGVATLHTAHACFGRLEELSLYSASEISDEQLSVLFSNVVLFRDLRRLHVDLLGFTGSFTAQAFAPLSRLHNLHALAVEHDVYCEMDDIDLAALVKFLPALVDLRLYLKGTYGMSRLIINALATLSCQPNDLRTLHFPLQSLRQQPDEVTALSSETSSIGTCLKGLEELTLQRGGEAHVYLERERMDDFGVFLRRVLNEECAKDVLAKAVVKIVTPARTGVSG